VTAARELQSARFEQMENIHYNAQMNTKHIREYCALDEVSKQLLKTAMERLNLSARAYDRILKVVARTIADLDAAPRFHRILPKQFSIEAWIVMGGWGNRINQILMLI
jgi:magnesium chelatase family protein